MQAKINFLEHYTSETRELDLSRLGITDTAVINDLIPFLNEHPEVECLLLDSNIITSEGAKALSGIKTLKALSLSNNMIGDEGAKAFQDNTTLDSLYLILCGIKTEGMIGLAANSTLTSLCIESNEFSLEAAKAFAENTTLINLDIMDTDIGDDEVFALVTNTTLKNLEVFDDLFPTTTIGPEGLAALNESNPISRANYGRRVNMQSAVPSLKRLSLFAIKQSVDLHAKKGNQNEEKLLPFLNEKKLHPLQTELLLELAKPKI